jgi:hypothetical protein
MLDRRRFLGGACASLWLAEAAATGAPVADGARLAFTVFREGSEIGAHSLTFARNGEVSTIQVTIDLVVKLGPVPLFRYEHRATEVWTGATFSAVDAQTNEAPANALPSTHWNRRMLDGPFINTQTGELTNSAVTPRGAASVETASGRKITVRRFEIAGPPVLETWYDEQMTWAGLQFKARDGSQIVYKRQG